LDAVLIGQPLLERRQHQAGRDHAGLALADHLEQIHLLERFRIAHALRAAFAQLHRYGIELLMRQQRVTASTLLRETCAVPSTTYSTPSRCTRSIGWSCRSQRGRRSVSGTLMRWLRRLWG
jgi:hypothetical protein